MANNQKTELSERTKKLCKQYCQHYGQAQNILIEAFKSALVDVGGPEAAREIIAMLNDRDTTGDK